MAISEPAHKNLHEALLAFQQKAPTLTRTETNPHYKNKYVALDSITEEVMPVLSECGLVWTCKPCMDEKGNPALRYRLIHVATGELEDEMMPLILSKQDMQGLGSALSYGRRYVASAALNLRAEDDDGQRASEQPTQALRTPKPKTPPAPEDRPLNAQELQAMRDAIKRAGQDEYLLLAKAGVDKTVRLSHARDIRDTLDRLEGSGK